MNQAMKTIDGWYCLHEFRTIDWPNWKSASENGRERALSEFNRLLNKWNSVEERTEAAIQFIQLPGKKPI